MAWNEEQSPELKLPFNTEMFHSKVVLPIVGKRFVERCVLFVSDVLRFAHPEGLVLVELLPLMGDLLHFFSFLLFRFFFLLFIDLFNFWFISFLTFFFLFFLFVFGVCDLLFSH